MTDLNLWLMFLLGLAVGALLSVRTMAISCATAQREGVE